MAFSPAGLWRVSGGLWGMVAAHGALCTSAAPSHEGLRARRDAESERSVAGGYLQRWAGVGGVQKRPASEEGVRSCGSVERGGIEPRGCTADVQQVAEDLSHLGWIGDEGDEAHLVSASGADQRIDFVDLCDQLCPCRTAGLLRHREGLGRPWVRGYTLGVQVLPSCGGHARDVGPVRPSCPAPGSIQAVGVEVAHAPRDARGRLSPSMAAPTLGRPWPWGEGGDEIHGVPQRRVVFEVGVVAGVVENLGSGCVVGELLQREGGTSHVLGEGLAGAVIACLQSHGTVHREPGVSPAQESFGKLTR